MKVTLVSYTQNPELAMCMAVEIMKEKDPLKAAVCSDRPHKEACITEILKSRLRGALEFATFEFLLEDVSRAFTHQLVRHRTFHFSQQSMRFFDASESAFRVPKGAFSERINEHFESTRLFYQDLLADGCPTEDARSILPTNVCTKIMFGATFRGLLELAEVRMCAQSQGEFREAMEQIKKEVEKVSPFLGGLMVPACERSGHCEFKSVYDRKCPKIKGGERHGSGN